MKRLLAAGMCALTVGTAGLARAQGDAPLTAPIQYGDQVTETITQEAFYDWWQIEALAGEVLVVEMRASDGLAPLLGLLDPGGTLVARSADGAVDGFAELEVPIEQDGLYTIVPTRVGNADGLTAGTYQLRVGLAGGAPAPTRPYEEVTFRCGADEAAVVAAISFPVESAPSGEIRAYGIDGLIPVIRVTRDTDDAPLCGEAGAIEEDSFTLPGETEPTTEAPAARLAYDFTGETGTITITIGSAGSAAGRVLAAVSGFTIDPADESEYVTARVGPLAVDGGVTLYMLDAERGGRLDPYVRFEAEAEGCDDTGARRGDPMCTDVLTVNGAGVETADGLRLLGDRFDAGLRLISQREPQPLVLESFRGNTAGAFGVLLLGELP
jgi:hypothetical protein